MTAGGPVGDTEGNLMQKDSPRGWPAVSAQGVGAAAAPTYEGRALVRPDDEVVDQGLGFDIDTLLDRRAMLRAAGIGAAGLGLAACGSDTGASSDAGSGTTSASVGEIPDETAGPYPGNGSNGPDVLERSGIVRSDITSSFGESSGSADGVPMTLELTLTDLANGGIPFEGAAVYVWHCDAEGRYSMYSSGVEDQNYLRGVQVADAQGLVRFTSIFPAWYAGRWPHVHLEVYPDVDNITDVANVVATSQVALPEDACSQVYSQAGYESSVSTFASVSLDGDTVFGDTVFGDDGGASQLGTVSGDVSNGFTVALPVAVDTTTMPSGGGVPGRPGGGAPGGPPHSR